MEPIAVNIDGLIYAKQAHGGISRNFTNLINAFAERSDADVNLYLEPGVAAPEGMSAVRVRRLPGDVQVRPSRVFNGLSASFSDRRRRFFWKSLSSGIFHSSFYSSPEGLRIPQVLTMHDSIFEDYPLLFSSDRHRQHLAEKQRALRACDALVFPSEFAKERTRENYNIGERPAVVIPHAVGPLFYHVPSKSHVDAMQQEIAGMRPFLLHVGSRYLHKNVPKLLQAFSGWEQRTQIALVLAGGGLLQPEEQQLISSLGIEDDVFVWPRMSDHELHCAYYAATAFVFPSLSEGFGFPVLEALACGCPTACSNAASLPEVGGNAPVYFDPVETDSIRSALSEVVSLVGDKARWGAAREDVNRRKWKDVAGEYLNFYRRVVASDSASSATPGVKR